MTTHHNPEKGRPQSLSCEAWEALLVDALDGKLDANDAAAFHAHSQECGAGCGDLLEEARRGSEWLQYLRETPPAPEGLVDKILAGTSGLPEANPLVPAGAVAIPHQPWLGVPLHLLQRHMAESRIVMTLAMAFFSIALTLNLTGVRLNQLKLSDLKPSTLASTVSHEYFSTSKNVKRYYQNLRFVYEVESRLNEMRGETERPGAGAPSGITQPEPSKPTTTEPQPATRPSSKAGGSARKGGSSPQAQPQPGHSRADAPSSVLAKFPLNHRSPQTNAALRELYASSLFPGLYPDLYPGTTRKTSERSLV